MPPKERLTVNEIFFSLQGESSRAGRPCVFVRLTGCNLRCGYCDTTYAYQEGREMYVEQIIDEVKRHHCGLVEITGGEPLMQPETAELARWLIELDYTVMIETNGSYDVGVLPQEVVKIVDIKTPGSGEGESFIPGNLKHLEAKDEIKFVICSRADFDWAVATINEHRLTAICPVNISPAAGNVSPQEAAEWILNSGLDLRLNLQLHRIIWGDRRGV